MTRAAPVSLVIGGETDAQTPRSGHTVLFLEESACVDAIGTAYLLDGTLPEQMSCEVKTEENVQ